MYFFKRNEIISLSNHFFLPIKFLFTISYLFSLRKRKIVIFTLRFSVYDFVAFKYFIHITGSDFILIFIISFFNFIELIMREFLWQNTFLISPLAPQIFLLHSFFRTIMTIVTILTIFIQLKWFRKCERCQLLKNTYIRRATKRENKTEWHQNVCISWKGTRTQKNLNAVTDKMYKCKCARCMLITYTCITLKYRIPIINNKHSKQNEW